MTREEEAIALVRKTLALVRAELDRPRTPEGDQDSQRKITRELTPTDPDGQPMELGVLIEMTTPRTRFFDRQVLGAIEAGIGQVVICGAGYDDRALRFRHPDVQFFELDLPAVEADKARRLEASGADTSRLTLVPADFRVDDVADVLVRSGHDATRPTLFIAEHLIVFLERADVVRLVAGLAGRSAPGSTLAVTLEVHGEELDSDRVVAEFNADFFGDITPMPTILSRSAFLSLFAHAGWQVENPNDVNGIDHTELIQTQFVSAVV